MSILLVFGVGKCHLFISNTMGLFSMDHCRYKTDAHNDVSIVTELPTLTSICLYNADDLKLILTTRTSSGSNNTEFVISVPRCV